MSALAQTEVLNPGLVSLPELAEIANREHEATGSALAAAITHAIRCGLALLQARDRLDPAEWKPWVAENLTFTPQHAGRYMRLAHYRDELPEEIRQPSKDVRGRCHQPSINRALLYVRGLPAIYPHVAHRRVSDDIEREVKRLRKTGLEYRVIAEMFGIAMGTAYRICNPDARQRYRATKRQRDRRLRQATQTLARREQVVGREKAARLTGGALAEAYSLVRRLAQRLDEARVETSEAEEREALSLALTRAHQAEDAVAKALRVP